MSLCKHFMYVFQKVNTKTANHPKPPETTRNKLKPSETIYSYLKPSNVIHPKPSAFLQNQQLPAENTHNTLKSYNPLNKISLWLVVLAEFARLLSGLHCFIDWFKDVRYSACFSTFLQGLRMHYPLKSF